MGFPGDTVVKNPPANTGDIRDVASIPGLGRYLGIGNGNPFQYSCLENSMVRGVWQATVHGVERVGYNRAYVHTQIKRTINFFNAYHS